MIPLISLFKLVSIFLSCIATFHLRQNWEKNREDDLIYSFYRFFFYFSIAIFTFLLPPLGLNPYLIQIDFYITNFFIFISLAYIGRIVLSLTFFIEMKERIFKTIVIVAFLDLILGALYFRPALDYIYEFGGMEFIGWLLNWPPLLMFLHALVIILFAILTLFLFIIKGLTLTDPLAKRRSLLLGIGAAILSIAAIAFYSLGSLIEASFGIDIIHGFSTVLGLIIVLIAIYQKENNLKKIKVGRS